MSKKNIQKSVRLTEKVYNYVMKCEGDGFNEKFENMVLHCMESEKQCTIWESSAEEAKKQVAFVNRRLMYKLRNLEINLESLYRQVGDVLSIDYDKYDL